MTSKLDPRKVIIEINILSNELGKCVEEKKDYDEIHEKVLNLCKISSLSRKDYKTIDVEYPNPRIIIFDDGFSDDGAAEEGTNEIQLPSAERVWEGKIVLAKEIDKVLKKVRDIHSLKLKLM